MKKFFIKWVLIGLFLRLVLMPFTAHSDMTALDLGAWVISQKGEFLTFYDYLTKLEGNNLLVSLYGVGLFNYPPLAYLTPAFFMFILSPFYDFSVNFVFVTGMDKIFQTFELFKTIFLLKLPYLLFDFLLAFLLFKIFKEKGKTAFKIWMLNPLTLYATFAMGQFDIIPTLLVVAALFFAFQKRSFWAVAMLGLGGAFKMFPLLFLPFFALVLGKGFWRKWWLFMVGLLPYLIIIAPFFIFSPMYRQAAFLTSQTEKMLYLKLPLSGAEYLSPFLIGYFILLFLAASSRGQKDILWRLSFVLMILFFSVTHFHPQWFLWITPFLIWDWLVYGPSHRPFLIAFLGCWLILTFFFEPSLHIGLFAPVAPNLLKLGGLTELVGRFYDPFFLKSVVRSFFAGVGLFLSFQLLSRKAKGV
ncbi:DUF2029 domain-containing protein [Candidatus Shapirobacteria bacterium]|nr:DUF2029 domain-containing protein [Candidatus Shapirobacteria bacterium]